VRLLKADAPEALEEEEEEEAEAERCAEFSKIGHIIYKLNFLCFLYRS